MVLRSRIMRMAAECTCGRPLEYGRLQKLAKLVPLSSCIADVGCDHGKLCAILLATRPALRVIASDVSAPSLAKACGLLASRFDRSRFECRLGDGLHVLRPGEPDAIVIAGLGGLTIAGILEDALETARATKYLLLSPNSRVDWLRSRLAQLDFALTDEWIVKEKDRFYPILLASPGNGRLETDAFHYYFGRALAAKKQEPETAAYIRSLRGQTLKVISALGAMDRDRLALLTDRLERLEALLV